MHMQTTVQNWDKALVKMPDYTLLKAVNDASILIDGRNKWIAAGRDPAKLFLDHRYVTFYYPDFDGADQDKTLDEYKIIWRANFAKTIDATYYTKYAPYIRLVEELNEYTDTRMITDKALLAPRLRSARAAVLVWNAEYRGRNGIPDDARLVVCNSPVGNDVPIEYFQLCRDEDAVLGVRTYTHWVNKVRDPKDFRYHSGRPFFNEQEYGIKVDYVLGETGPYDGSTWNGWRAQSCMSGDPNLLVEGMEDWWKDLATTNAYQEGRILGPGAWFTSTTHNDWNNYKLWESELVPLAEACARIWQPGEPPPDPEPPPPDPEPVPYVVVVNLLPQDTTLEEKWQVLNAVHDDKQTILQSADDAARLVVPGKTGSKVRVWEPDRWQDSIVDWLEDKGVELIDLLEFEPPPPPEPFLLWPVDNQHIVNSPFNDERSYGPHEGIDLYAQEGDAIYACRDGQVVWASDKRRSDGQPSAYGRHIIIEHADGWVTWYAHLSDMVSAAGDVVERGDVIGAAGSTGNSTGPHLHLNVQHIGAGLSGYVIPDVVDPAPLLGL